MNSLAIALILAVGFAAYSNAAIPVPIAAPPADIDATYSELGKELEQLEHKLPGTFSNLVEKAKKIVINAHTARKSGNSEGIKNAANAGIELLEQGRLVLKQYPKLVKLIDKLLVKLENMLPKKDILGSSDDAVKYVDEKLPQATLETVQA